MPVTTAPEESFSASVDRMVDRALAHVNLPPGLAGEIKAVNSVLQVQFPVKLRDGSYHVFKGWRAVHSNVVAQRGFTDTQARGPLRAWQHTHSFSIVAGGVRVQEHVEYEHDSGWRGMLSRLLFNAPALGFLFWYRGWATRRALEK